jgi:mono/diheme cytochrome c family protein
MELLKAMPKVRYKDVMELSARRVRRSTIGMVQPAVEDGANQSSAGGRARTMTHQTYPGLVVLVIYGFCLGIPSPLLPAQPFPSHTHPNPAAPQMEATPDNHRTPQGWHFSWPQGDAVKGRELFVKLECYSCHLVQGEQFPAPGGDIGPELAAMGPLHNAAYFAEAIINPNAVIEPGKGYEAADGSSKMPSYNEFITVQEVVDLVAYLQGLKPPGTAPTSHGSGSGATGGAHKH